MVGTIEITNLQDGKVGEVFSDEVAKIIKDIKDPNKSQTASRKLAINIVFEPNDEGTSISTRIDTRTTLAPLKPIETTLNLSANGNVSEQIQEKMDLGGEDAA